MVESEEYQSEKKKMSEHKVCKICVMMKGLKGSDLINGKCPYAFKTDKELEEHLKKEHGVRVKA
jgi:hypothetical protein